VVGEDVGSAVGLKGSGSVRTGVGPEVLGVTKGDIVGLNDGNSVGTNVVGVGVGDNVGLRDGPSVGTSIDAEVVDRGVDNTVELREGVTVGDVVCVGSGAIVRDTAGVDDNGGNDDDESGSVDPDPDSELNPVCTSLMVMVCEAVVVLKSEFVRVSETGIEVPTADVTTGVVPVSTTAVTSCTVCEDAVVEVSEVLRSNKKVDTTTVVVEGTTASEVRSEPSVESSMVLSAT